MLLRHKWDAPHLFTGTPRQVFRNGAWRTDRKICRGDLLDLTEEEAAQFGGRARLIEVPQKEEPEPEPEPEPEQQVLEPPEPWTLATPPEKYLKQYPYGPNAALARSWVSYRDAEG